MFEKLIDRLIDASAEYLVRQLRAGAQAVQIFDSWAGALPADEFERWCLAPIGAIIAKVRSEEPHAPIIVFPRGVGVQITRFSQTEGLAALSLDASIPPDWAAAALPSTIVLQGNLDPIVLLAGGAALENSVDHILSGFSGRPHIFNLGHGILKETPISHVERLIKRVRGGR